MSKTANIGPPNVHYFAPPISVAEAKQTLKKRSNKKPKKAQNDGQMADVSAAARRATVVINGSTGADVTWTETRTMALMLQGTAFVEAVSQAAEECSARIIQRKLLETPLVVASETRGNKGQQPTLKTTLGDLLAARKRVQ